MSGSTGSPVTTQTQTRDPWSGAQPYLSSMYSTAENYQQNQVGYQPYSGPTVAPIDPYMAEALGGVWNQALGQVGQGGTGVPGVGLAQQVGQYVMGNQGITPQLDLTAQQFNANKLNYDWLYNQNLSQQNPYLLASIADQNRLAADRVASGMSAAGRYGSGQYADVMARAQAEVADPLLAQDYMQRQQIGLAAAQGIGTSEQQIANLYNQGLAQTGQWAQIMPGLNAAQYQPYQQMMGVGQFYQDRAQQDLQAQIALYNAQQAYPWQQLERQSAIMAGAGQLGGSTVTAQTPLQAPLSQRLLGGALVGGGLGSAVPGIGTGVGALGGALAGGFL